MLSQSRYSIPIESAHACARLQSQVLEVSRDSAVIESHKRVIRVLVADDNRDAARSLSMLVKIWGHEVRVAYDGAAALEEALVHQLDVLLLDISMPRIDGCQLVRQLRREPRFQDTLLIAITGWTDRKHRRLCQEAGFDLFLVKPVEPSTLETLLMLEQDRLAYLSAALLAAPRRTTPWASANHQNGVSILEIPCETGPR